ncbi:MAG TPA: GNAT family N-acetyltransferase, partial [Ideonella sp.]|nr:GNAT family N-acetyltransferase [Ideonella sp.]
MQIVIPTLDHLPGYIAALERGWSPDSQRGEVAAREELARLRQDEPLFIQQQQDREALGGPVTLPDG